MGYLKRKLRRSTAAVAAARFGRAASGGVPPGQTALPAVGFVRFAVGDSGLFQAAYALRDAKTLAARERAGLADQLSWFSAELRPHAPAEQAAIFWFKADAREHVGRVWGLVHFLQWYGQDVRMWTSRRPGRIVFEDASQVAAVAYRTGRREKQLPHASP